MNCFGYEEPTEREIEDAAIDEERSRCQWRNCRRPAAHDERTCLLVGYPAAGTICYPCALQWWGDELLRGTVPLELLEPEDRTLTHRELALSASAAWVLAGRMPRAALVLAVEYIPDELSSNEAYSWFLRGACTDCGRAYIESQCVCRRCDCCSRTWVSARLDGGDENGRPHEDCSECVGFVGEGVPVVIVAEVRL